MAISMIENDVYFTTTTNPSSTFLQFARIDMDTGAYRWRSQASCEGVSCSSTQSASLLSEDKSIIYASTPISNDAVFFQLNATDGTQLNSRYVFTASCSEANAVHSYKTKVYIILYCSYTYIVIHDISTLLFESHILNGNGMKIHSFKTDSTANRMLACGHGVSLLRAFSLISYEDTLDTHENITLSAMTYNAEAVMYAISNVGTSTTTISNYAVTNETMTSYTTFEILDSDQFVSSVSYWLNDYYAYNLTYNTYIEKDITLSCVASGGGTTITHTKVANGANIIPSWVTIDAVNSKLLMTTPKVTTETNFTFGISSYVSSDGKTYLRYVFLQVVVPPNPPPDPVVVPTTPEPYKCDSTFNLWTLIVIVLIFILEIVVSVLNLSISSSFWIVITQYQLISLLPLIGAYMPESVLNYCAGMKLFMFAGNLVDPSKIGGFNTIYNFMDSSQSNRYLSCIKMSSNSTFVNTFTLQLVMMLILSFHVLFLALYLLNRPFKVDEEKCTRKAIRWIFKKFTFDIYIRIINLCFIFVVLSSMFETYRIIFCHFYRNKKTSLVVKFLFNERFCLKSQIT